MPYSADDVTSLVLFIQKAYSLQLTDLDDAEFIEFRNGVQSILNDGLSGITGSADTPAQIVTKLESLTGTNRLNASAIRNIIDQLTGAQIKALLEALTGTDRLEASAIQNLPQPFNFSSLTANRLPVVNAAGNDFEDSDISVDTQGNINVAVSLQTPPSEVRIGTLSIRNGADSIFTRTVQTAIMRLFGTVTFDDSGTGNPIFPVLGARQAIPNGSQLLDDETLSISEGNSMSFTLTGVGIQDSGGIQIGDGRHINRSFTVRIVTGGTARLRVYRGTDASTVPIVDQTRVLIAGDNEIDLQSFPLVVPGQSYFIQYTSVVGTVFYRGSTIMGVFQPYFSVQGHPYSEQEVPMDGIAIEDEGTELSTLANRLNFTGAGVTVTGIGNEKTITIPGGTGTGGVTVQDEGSNLTTEATTLNFTGIGVTASGSGASKTINIPALTVQEEGVSLASEANTINFTGSGVTASGTGATKTVEIPGVANEIIVQDEGSALSGGASTLNFVGDGVAATGTGSTKTVTIPGAVVLNNVVNYTATGTQNVGGNLSNTLHILASTITGFDLLSAATISTNTLFAVANQSTSAVEFDTSATTFVFGGNASGNTYSIPASSTVIFFVNSTNVYPLTEAPFVPSGNQPLIVARDTPSIAQLTAIANESLNDNSGLWVVANDQIQATEDNVDPSVQIFALKTGFLDADNNLIPTAATAKSGVRLQAGTQVRVFSGTDLRVVSTPTIRETAVRYPDIGGIGLSPLNLRGNQTVYNTYRNRTIVLDDSVTVLGGDYEVRLPSLQDSVDLAYLNRSDVFGFRNDRTDSATFTIRTFQTGTSYSSGEVDLVLNSGQSLYISPALSGFSWQVLEIGQSADLPVEDILFNTDWYRDETDSTSADNSVRLHHRRQFADGIVRDHIKQSTFSNNPVTLRFQQRNVQDDIAWIQWWSVINPNANLILSIVDPESTVVEAATAVNFITTNYNGTIDFDFNDPELTISINSITFLTGQTVRVNVVTAIPTYIQTLDVIRINNSSASANNGSWAITNILPDRLAFDITIPGSSAANNTAAVGFIDRPIYARTVLISHDLRQINFNLFRNSARNNPLTVIQPGWFDVTTDPAPSNSVLSIGYNNDVVTTSAEFSVQDDTGNFYLADIGPLGNNFFLDNTGGNYQTVRTLPTNFKEIEIQTLGVATFYIPIFPDELPDNKHLTYIIHSNPSNDDDDVRIRVGDPANVITSDEGLTEFSIRDGTFFTIHLYNSSNRNGWRILNPISRTITSGLIYATAITADTLPNPLPITSINVLVAQSEDVNETFFNLDSSGVVTLQTNGDYDFKLSLELLYTGPAQTGTLFVPAGIITRLNNVDQARLSSNNQSLLLTSYTPTGGGTVSYAITLEVDIVDYQASVGDQIQWRLSFGDFPPGVSAANISVKDFTFTLTGKLNFN